MSLAGTLMQRFKRANWQPVSIAGSDAQLDLYPVRALIEVGFILWRKAENGHLEMVASGHTLRDQVVDVDGQPFALTHEDQATIKSLLGQKVASVTTK
jgi:hypothetical protein